MWFTHSVLPECGSIVNSEKDMSFVGFIGCSLMSILSFDDILVRQGVFCFKVYFCFEFFLLHVTML